MRIDKVRHVLSLGAGTMGQQIALQCAMHGYEVIDGRNLRWQNLVGGRPIRATSPRRYVAAT